MIGGVALEVERFGFGTFQQADRHCTREDCNVNVAHPLDPAKLALGAGGRVAGHGHG